MDDRTDKIMELLPDSPEDISRFTESYASFNRIINSLQRQYIELKEEFGSQNEELRQVNEKLIEATQLNLAATDFLNNILNSIGVGVIAVDLSGKITHFNPASTVILGLPAEEVVGKLYRDVIPPGDELEANAYRTLETGQPVEAVEKTVEREDNSRLYLSVSTALLKDKEGNARGAVEVFQDLTRIKRLEQELARLNTLAALGEMAATIAHEVRNPLSAISGFAALLKRDMEEDDPRRKMVNKISRGVESLNNTVTSLLNYTRYEEVNKEVVDYVAFLRQTVEQFKFDNPDTARNNKFDIQTPTVKAGTPLQMVMDPMLYRQLLYNLFTNAIEATNGKGRIKIVVRKLSRGEAAKSYGGQIVLGADESVIETIVTDNGPGLEEDILERIFTPFFTTKVEGNGLGLAMSWKIIKAHGGEIIAQNAEKGGAEFLVVMPARIEYTNMERI